MSAKSRMDDHAYPHKPWVSLLEDLSGVRGVASTSPCGGGL